MNNRLIWQLSFRYLRGKRSANAVPILSRISMVAIAVSSGAMIIIFSVFNGLESLVKERYKAFYPDLRIVTARGKFFTMDSAKIAVIRQTGGVRAVTAVIEDNAFAVSNDEQKVISLKGIDAHYFRVNDITPYIVQGDTTVMESRPQADNDPGSPNTAIMGQRILNELGTDINSLSYFTLNYPNPTVVNPSADPGSAFQSLRLHPGGVFRIEEEFDGKYILAPLPLVQELFKQAGKYSSIEIKAEPGKAKEIQEQLRLLLGTAFKVETRYEQNKTMYMVMGAEKWAVYAILLLVLLIASFNMVGALSMLVLEKQKDIAILKAMGATNEAIKKIFLLEGVLWSLVGGLSGIVLGVTVCLIQLQFGIVKLGGSFVVEAWPVEIQMRDLGLVISTILGVGLLVSWYPAIRSVRAEDPSLKSA